MKIDSTGLPGTSFLWEDMSNSLLATERKTLSQSLQSILADAGGGPVSIRRISEGVGDRGFGILLVVLSLPSALPVPAPGYSTPFGILLAILSLQIIALRGNVWLPEKAFRREIPNGRAVKFFSAAQRFLARFEHFIRPRLRWIVRPAGRIGLGIVTLFMAVLMMFPIPLTNTLPAMVIFLIGVGLVEEDGLFALASFALGIVAVLFYAYVIYLLATYGVDGVVELKEWIKQQIQRGS